MIPILKMKIQLDSYSLLLNNNTLLTSVSFEPTFIDYALVLDVLALIAIHGHRHVCFYFCYYAFMFCCVFVSKRCYNKSIFSKIFSKSWIQKFRIKLIFWIRYFWSEKLNSEVLNSIVMISIVLNLKLLNTNILNSHMISSNRGSNKYIWYMITCTLVAIIMVTQSIPWKL